MDDKTLTAVATSLALMQIQVNALMLLLERHTPGVPIKEEVQQLISEGVQTVGLETIQGIKSRMYEGIIHRRRTRGMAIIDENSTTVRIHRYQLRVYRSQSTH